MVEEYCCTSVGLIGAEASLMLLFDADPKILWLGGKDQVYRMTRSVALQFLRGLMLLPRTLALFKLREKFDSNFNFQLRAADGPQKSVPISPIIHQLKIGRWVLLRRHAIS